MKRLLAIPVMVCALAACGSQSLGHGSYDGSATGTNVSSSGQGGVAGFTTVSGTVVRRDNGLPYPRAYVRFGWLVNASYEREAHTVTDAIGGYRIQIPPGVYQVSAGDTCDLNAGFTIVGRQQDDNMVTVQGPTVVDFEEYPITPGADLTGVC